MENKPDNYDEFLKEEFLTVHEAAEMLEITEEELRGMIHRREIPTHNVAGVFLRLKKKEVEEVKNRWRIERELFPGKEEHFSHHHTFQKPTIADKLADFWYFNDFYIVCSVLIVALVTFIISSQ